MSLFASLQGRMSLPVIGAPLFIISVPQLVIAQCKAGIVGSMPSLNARPGPVLDEWLAEITEALAGHDAANPDAPAAPFAINLIVHRSNDRLDHDIALCEKYRVPLVITSLGARPEVNAAVHGWGGHVLHDVTTLVHARKAIEKGADGLIAVAAGAGGHAGTLSPFALVQEIRQWFGGPLALSGAMATGAGVLAAQAMGADFAYIGTAFIATEEARAAEDYKAMILQSAAGDIVYTNLFTGVHGNYLKPSILRAGLDPDNLPTSDASKMNFGSDRVKPWRDVWGAGQGVGSLAEVQPAAALIARLRREYQDAAARLHAPNALLRPAVAA